jgi:ATP-dependent Clp protease ATP-binding subunit ClpA
MTSNVGAEDQERRPFGFQKRDEDVNYEKMKEMLRARSSGSSGPSSSTVSTR